MLKKFCWSISRCFEEIPTVAISLSKRIVSEYENRW